MDTLKQFLSAERYMQESHRAGAAPRERWQVVTGADEVRILTTAELDEALTRLDANRHPWGEPGVVPAVTVGTKPFWYSAPDSRGVYGDPDACWVDCNEDVYLDDGGLAGEFVDGGDCVEWCFRTRWTPAPPTTEETGR